MHHLPSCCHAARLRAAAFCLLTALLISPLCAQTVVDEEATIHDATQTAELRGLLGEEVIVQGRVERVGVGPGGVIHFINFVGSKRGDFTVIVKRELIPLFQGSFGGEFPFDLAQKEIQVTGLISLHEETPQIELRDPSQLKVLD